MANDITPAKIEEQAVIRIAKHSLGSAALAVRDFKAQEAIGHPFLIEVVLVVNDSDIDFKAALGTNLTLVMDLPNQQQRYLDGVITDFAFLGQIKGGFGYRAVLRPWFALLHRNIQTKIYQTKTVPEIISAVFKNADFDNFRDDTKRSPFQKLDFCVQYQESDFDFVHRLMEQEGIYYYFEHANGKHTMVLADDSSAQDVYSGFGTLSYASSGDDAVYEETVTDWMMTKEIQSGKFTIRDRDYENPGANLEKVSSINDVSKYGDFEVYEWPGKYKVASDGDTYAKLRMEERAAQFARANGVTGARWIAAGTLLNVKDAPRKDQNAKYLIIETTMRSKQGKKASSQGIETEFWAIPTAHPFRMPRVTPRPYIRGPQTAIVTGTSGEEIYTDKFARVKVQFYWDRDGNNDESSSCWIRCAQPWAAKGWGTVFIPRIKQEVVVHFIEGDPDQPIITGAVYNGPDAQTPVTLPDQATQSTIKTNSSKGGSGFNQIRFEDKAGSEELFVQAQKDYNIKVLNNRTITTHQDLTETVEEGKRSITISKGEDILDVTQGKQTVTINGDQSITIKQGNHSLTVSTGTSTISSPQSITLKVGDNSVVIDTSGVTIKGMTVKVQGEVETKVTAAQVEVDGTGTTTIKGGIVMINS